MIKVYLKLFAPTSKSWLRHWIKAHETIVCSTILFNINAIIVILIKVTSLIHYI